MGQYKILIAILCLLLNTATYLDAQPNKDKYRDKKWLAGYCSNCAGTHLSGWGISQLDFTANGVDTSTNWWAANFSAASTSLCDTSGNIVAYSNGIRIYDKNNQIMQGGDSLGYFSDTAYWNGNKKYGSGILQSNAIILPTPCQDNCSVMLYPKIETSNGLLQGRGIYGAYINTQFNNGLGAVTSKDNLFIADSIQAPLMSACRHGNGRDWWHIAPKYLLGKYYKLLLTEQGITTPMPQIMTSLPEAVAAGGIYAAYSADGSQYAHYNAGRGIYIYSFDRCSGNLSNRRFLPTPNNHTFSGVAFSPNSQYLYLTNLDTIYQYNTYAADIAASKTVVWIWDRVRPPLQNYTIAAFFPQLAPNGKIYISMGPSTGRYYHVINKPNEAGIACNVQQFGLLLPTRYDNTMPNFPNFRLGALKGSPCDTLGIEAGVTVATSAAPQPATLRGSLFPNPADGSLTLGIDPSDNYTYDDNLPSGYAYTLSDVLGRVLRTESMARERTSISTAALPNGIYYVSVRRQGRVVFSGKVVVQHE